LAWLFALLRFLETNLFDRISKHFSFVMISIG